VPVSSYFFGHKSADIPQDSDYHLHMAAILQTATFASELLQNSIEGITTFFLLREQPSGGFSAGRYMPATLEDTYHAVRCLKAIDTFSADGQNSQWHFPGAVLVSTHIDFLKYRMAQDWNHSRRLFHILYCLNAFNFPVSEHNEGLFSTQSVRDFLRERIRIMPSIDECFYALRTARMFNNETTMPLDNMPPLTDYSIDSLAELRMLLYLTRHGDRAEFDRVSRQWLPWLKRCLNGDGGYGFFPGTTSYIENVYHAMESYRIIQAAPAKAHETVGFIRACRSARGGFGRRCQGIPFPDSTWHGTAALIFLSRNNDMFFRNETLQPELSVSKLESYN